MTPAELLALANRLRYACRDPVTGEPLHAGVSADACVEDVEAAARYLRDCAEAEPAAWMESPHGVIRANPLYRWTAPQSLAWTIPLYTHPQPPSDQDDAVEALRRLVSAIIDDDGGDDDGNAPGHAHETPGVWDDDNRAGIAGKPCELCAAWNHARAVLAEISR